MKTELSEIVKEIRDRYDLNNRDLAEKVGYSESFINNVLYGDPQINAKLLIRHFAMNITLTQDERLKLKNAALKAEARKDHMKINAYIRFLYKNREILTEENLKDLKKLADQKRRVPL